MAANRTADLLVETVREDGRSVAIRPSPEYTVLVDVVEDKQWLRSSSAIWRSYFLRRMLERL